MDEVAGIVAARHCKTNIVTASVDAINFHRKIKKGNSENQTDPSQLIHYSSILNNTLNINAYLIKICFLKKAAFSHTHMNKADKAKTKKKDKSTGSMNLIF